MSTIRFDPEILVVAGRAKEPGGQELLQENFSLKYAVENATILQNGDEPLGKIIMEEPFRSQMVKSLYSILGS